MFTFYSYYIAPTTRNLLTKSHILLCATANKTANMKCLQGREVHAGAAQKCRRPPTLRYITVDLEHFLREVRKSPTATNQKVGGSNPFWRTRKSRCFIGNNGFSFALLLL